MQNMYLYGLIGVSSLLVISIVGFLRYRCVKKAKKYISKEDLYKQDDSP